MRERTQIYVGTSGWVYKGWHELFYPKDLKKDFLRFYSRHFNTVEINNSFYHLPAESSFEKWRDETPADFVFSVKISRYITHIKRLKSVRREVKTFFKRASKLERKFGSVLVQLPPSLPFKIDRLKKFLDDIDNAAAACGRRPDVALEPRHPSWFLAENESKLIPLCRQNKIALVFANSSGLPSYAPRPEFLTADFAYFRFHGPGRFAASLYGVRRLKKWAKLANNLGAGLKTYAYFNNDINGYAVKDAEVLMAELKSYMKVMA